VLQTYLTTGTVCHKICVPVANMPRRIYAFVRTCDGPHLLLALLTDCRVFKSLRCKFGCNSKPLFIHSKQI